MENTKGILERLYTVWHFEDSPLIHDIPLPVYEVGSGTKSLMIPHEALAGVDFDIIDRILAKLSVSIYSYEFDENKLNSIPANELDTGGCFNELLFDHDLNWVMGISGVFTGVGIALTFAGEELIKEVKTELLHHKKWFGEW